MRKIIFALIAIAISAHGQVSTPSIRDSATDPTGVACTSAAPILRYTAAGTSTMYACTGTGGTVYAAMGSNGNITASIVIKTSGSPFTVPATSGFYWNNTASAYSFNLPAPVIGLQLCFGNYNARSSAVSIIPSTGVTIYFKGVAGTISSATGLVSAGAVGDQICVVATDATTYTAMGAGYGTWTNN